MPPDLNELRELSGWEPPLGVASVYLGFQPGDRSGAWRTELRNGAERLREEAEGAEHERRIALRATAERLLERYADDAETRPPPRGEAGFVEVAEKAGREHWFAGGVEPPSSTVSLDRRPRVAGLVDLLQRGAAAGVAVISSERVRLLELAEGELKELEDWEMTYFELDWRERKAQSTSDPARAQGPSSSGRDQYDQRLEHNRERFLVEAGKLAGEKLRERGIERALVFGPTRDWEELAKGFEPTRVAAEQAEAKDLITEPIGRLLPTVGEAAERAAVARDRVVVERALGEADASRPGALGLQDTSEALAEGRAQHLVFDAALGEPAEELVRAALASGAGVTIVRDELAENLAAAEGVAAILRY